MGHERISTVRKTLNVKLHFRLFKVEEFGIRGKNIQYEI